MLSSVKTITTAPKLSDTIDFLNDTTLPLPPAAQAPSLKDAAADISANFDVDLTHFESGRADPLQLELESPVMRESVMDQKLRQQAQTRPAQGEEKIAAAGTLPKEDHMFKKVKPKQPEEKADA